MTDHIILLSEKSSGSSIFQRELTKHSKINTVEWTLHSEDETLYWIKAANILGYPKDSFWASHTPFPARHSRRSIDALLKNNLGTIPTSTSDWEYLKTGYEQLIELCGPVFMEKSPHHLNQWPALSCINRFVKESDKNIKFIGLVRNPLSVIYSTHQRWNTEAVNRQYMWEQSYRNLLAMKELYSPEQFMLIRYEDLIHSPPEQFKKVLSFIGLEYEEAIGKDMHSNSLNKWVQDKNFSFKVAPSVMLLGQHFGYTEEEMTCLKKNVVTSPANKFTNHFKRLLFRLRSTINYYRQHVL